MASLNVPIKIAYHTDESTPIREVIYSLEAIERITNDSISLLPSFINGLQIESNKLSIKVLSQESPLKEILTAALVIAFQENLNEEVPRMLESIFDLKISDKYDSIVTIIFMIVVFCGIDFAFKIAQVPFSDTLSARKLSELCNDLALETGKSPSEVHRIIKAKYAKPSNLKRIAKASKDFFIPSKIAKNAPVSMNGYEIPTEIVREVPYVAVSDADTDFNKYTPIQDLEIEIHAQDRDKSKTGWAAIAPSISRRRLKVTLVEPLTPDDLWGLDNIIADVVIVNKLTSNGYEPTEIQIQNIRDEEIKVWIPIDQN